MQWIYGKKWGDRSNTKRFDCFAYEGELDGWQKNFFQLEMKIQF